MEIPAEILGEWLLRTTVEGGVLILIVLALGKLLGAQLGPRWRVLLWTAVGLKLLLPASLPFVPGFGNWGREEPVAVPAVMIEDAQPERGTALALPAPTEIPEVAAEPVATSRDPLPWLLLVWALGTLVVFAAVLFRQRSYLRGAGLQACRDPELLALVQEAARELDLRRGFRVALAPAGTTPAVCGCFRATLVMPADWSQTFDPAVLRPILLHELEHIRQGDLILNWIAVGVNALHWFNPLVWIAASRFQADRELRCDLNAIARLPLSGRIDYGRALLRVQREFRPAPAIAGVAPCVRNHPSLQQRIQMIAKPTPRKPWLNAILAPGIAGILAISFGSATADEKKPEPPQDAKKSRDGGPRDGGPRDDSPRDGSPREGGPREGGPREGGPREGGPREGGPREGGPREGGPREGGPREGGPREGGPRDGSPREGGPRDGSPREGGMHPRPFGVFVVRDGVRLGDRVVPMSQLRGEFSKVRAHSAVVSAEPDIPFHQVNEVVDALRDTGIRDIRFGGRPGPGPRGEEGRPMPGGPRDGGPRDGGPRDGGPRDGDRPRPEGGPRDGGPRDGDRPRPEGGPRDGGPRDGDRPRPEGASRDGGPRDGDRPRPEEGPRDGGPRDGGPRDGDRAKPEGPEA